MKMLTYLHLEFVWSGVSVVGSPPPAITEASPSPSFAGKKVDVGDSGSFNKGTARVAARRSRKKGPLKMPGEEKA